MEHKVDNDEEKRPPNDNRKRPTVETTQEFRQPIKKEPSSWEKFKETEMSKTATFWACLASVVLTMMIGFWWGGWVTSATAAKMVSSGAKTAVNSRLANVCVAQFNLDAAKAEKLTEMKALTSYKQGDYASTQGWVTFPGDEKPDSQVASQCAKLILEANP